MFGDEGDALTLGAGRYEPERVRWEVRVCCVLLRVCCTSLACEARRKEVQGVV